MTDKKVRNASSYQLDFFFLSSADLSFLGDVVVIVLIASMHTHAQEICYYDDLLCCFFSFFFFSAVFCDRRAYVHTRSSCWQASSNLVSVCVCPWEERSRAKKLPSLGEREMYVSIINFFFTRESLSELLLSISFFANNWERNCWSLCLFLAMQIRRAKQWDIQTKDAH